MISSPIPKASFQLRNLNPPDFEETLYSYRIYWKMRINLLISEGDWPLNAWQCLRCIWKCFLSRDTKRIQTAWLQPSQVSCSTNIRAKLSLFLPWTSWCSCFTAGIFCYPSWCFTGPVDTNSMCLHQLHIKPMTGPRRTCLHGRSFQWN